MFYREKKKGKCATRFSLSIIFSGADELESCKIICQITYVYSTCNLEHIVLYYPRIQVSQPGGKCPLCEYILCRWHWTLHLNQLSWSLHALPCLLAVWERSCFSYIQKVAIREIIIKKELSIELWITSNFDIMMFTYCVAKISTEVSMLAS